jgi:hypothetical protein
MVDFSSTPKSIEFVSDICSIFEKQKSDLINLLIGTRKNINCFHLAKAKLHRETKDESQSFLHRKWRLRCRRLVVHRVTESIGIRPIILYGKQFGDYHVFILYPSRWINPRDYTSAAEKLASSE